MRLVINVVVALFCIRSSWLWAGNSGLLPDMVDIMLEAREQGRAAVVLTAQTTMPLDLEQAYRLQNGYVKKLLAGNQPYGFKAGLSSKQGQAKFNAPGPIAGTLIAPILPPSKRSISMQLYHRMMIEAELGFYFSATVDKPIDNIEQLQSMVRSVVPVIELPDLGFDNPEQLQLTDIVANNVAAKYWLLGAPRAIDALDINQTMITVTKDQSVILEAKANQVMEDQWQALLWLVNHTVANGWVTQPGQLLITGAIGNMMVAKPGDYQANFSGLGLVSFSITQ